MKVKIARIAGISERDLYSLHIFEPANLELKTQQLYYCTAHVWQKI